LKPRSMPGLFVNSSEVQNPPYGQWPRQHYGGCSAEWTPARPPQKCTAVIIHRCEHSGAEKQPTHKPDQCPDDRRHNVFSVKPHRTSYVVAQRIERQDKLTRHTGLIARTYGFRCSLGTIYTTSSHAVSTPRNGAVRTRSSTPDHVRTPAPLCQSRTRRYRLSS